MSNSLQNKAMRYSRSLAVAILSAYGLFSPATNAIAEPPQPLKCDPTKVLGHEACAKCHANEVQTWLQTPHSRTFETLHRTPEAKQILKNLGLRSAKRNDTCVKCHYTQQQQGTRVRAVSGVSCESCHGAAEDWVNLHADYGGPNVTAESETSDHRKQRRLASIDAGMNNPTNLYLIAQQCYSCHTVPDENLVNEGGHLPGSQEFELVAWSQGKVRHNFLNPSGVNSPSSPERLRVMYVVGVMADLEHSLRATAVATEKADFGRASAMRAARMKHRLHEIQELIDDPQVELALEAVATLELKLENSDAIVTAADEVGNAAKEFAVAADGTRLSAIDPLLPNPTEYKN